jgi:hypothetical protein
MHGFELARGDGAEVADEIDHFGRGADRQVPAAARSRSPRAACHQPGARHSTRSG